METHGRFNLYVFGDQTYDIQIKDLRTLVYDGKDDPVVVEFLERARRTIRNDLHQLNSENRRHTPSFSCTADFLAWKKGHCVPVDMAMLCLYQLGSFMRQVGHSYPSPANSCCLGLCTGALAAAAASCSYNTLELLPLAVEAVRLAFRIGMLVDKMARSIEPWDYDAQDNGSILNNMFEDGLKTDSQRILVPCERLPWTFLVTDSDVDAALGKYNEENNLPSTTRPWISARSTGDTVAVSGRPSSLARFFEWRQSLKPKQRSPRPLQLFAPYHAPHLYSHDDIEHLIHPPHISNWQSGHSLGSESRLRIPLISSTTGKVMQATNHHIDFRAVSELAVEQILLQPICWDPVLVALKLRLQELGDTTALRVLPVATTVDQLIYNGLQQRNPSACLSGRASENNDHGWTSSAGSTSTPNGEKIAIIGMAGRFPEAATTDALWDILRLGFDVCKEVPPLRWNVKTNVDPSGRRQNSSKTSLGCWLNDPDVFDAEFFGISAKEALRMDPAQRLALMTTYEAIEQAGVVWSSSIDGATARPSTRPDRVGVYCGVSGNDWRDFNAAQRVDSHFMRASNRTFISARISEVFKLRGPSITVDTSSSGSLAPLHIACRSLCAQETDMCVVGGAHIMTNPDVHAGFDRAGVLSHSGNCKVFEETADGFCRGEGVVSFVLKRLEDALAGNDTIMGVIAGVATNYDLHLPTGDSDSAHGTAQKSLFTEVLNRSNVDPASVTYVEMGGPRPNVQDVSQVINAVNVLAPKSTPGSAAKRTTPLYLGSAMANIGHGEATSGLSSIVKVLLMLRENIIPPHIGTHTGTNSKFPANLAQNRNTHINTGNPITWENGAEATSRCEPRRALVHDQGTIGRASSAILLEEKPLQNQKDHESSAARDRQLEKDPSARYIIAVSAKSKTSLHRNMANLYAWLKNESNRNRFTLAQISYTTTARRSHYAHRTMLVGSSNAQFCTQLCAKLKQSRVQLKPAPTGVSSIATTDQSKLTCPIIFAFTKRNPSSSSVEYFRQLYKNFSQVRQDMEHLEKIVRSLDMPSVLDALGLRGSDLESNQRSESAHPYNGKSTSQTMVTLSSMYTQAVPRFGLPSVPSTWEVDQRPHQQVHSKVSDNDIKTRPFAKQLASMCIQVVLARLWRSWGIIPIALVAEGDLEAFSALNFAGVLSDADAIYLAGAYIQNGLLQQMNKGRPGRGGDWAGVTSVEFERLHRVTAYHKARIPVLRLITDKAGDERSSNPRLDILASGDEDAQMLMTLPFFPNIKPAKFDSSPTDASATRGDLIAACRASNLIPEQSIIQSMGPESPQVLGAISDEISDGSSLGGDAHIFNTAEGRNTFQEQPKTQMWSHLTETLRKFYHAGANIRWDEYHTDLPPRSRRVISTLPAYSWDLKEYWIPYENDCTLLKGDASRCTMVPKLESTTIHTVVEETELFEDEASKLRLVVEADISRHDLHGIVQGHVVDGVPLCTPSVYADIALSLGEYMQQRYRHGCQGRLINIENMSVTKALIAQPSGPQMLQAHVEVDWDSNSATCTFSTLDLRGKIQQHANCTIMFGNTDIMNHVEQFDMAGSYSKLVQALRQGVSTQRTVRFTRNMMYRMISSLAEFHPDHKLVEDIVLDSQTHEATALVRFGQLLAEDGRHAGSFHTHPAVVDALTQPAGFALNGADTTDLDKEVYINHGWGSFYLFEPLELTKAYTVYVHMAEGDDHIWYGDIVVLDMSNNDTTARVVALFEKYSVQRMPRRVLSILLRAEGGGAYKNAKAQSGQGRQTLVDHRQDTSPRPARQKISSSSSTLVSPTLESERSLALRPGHISSVTASALQDRGQQKLHIKVGIPAPAAGPPTPLTAKALSFNNNIISSLGRNRDASCELVKRSLQIISEETGHDLADIDDDKLALADLGVDSLLSLAIISRFREELGDSLGHLDLNKLFMTCPTIAALKAALVGNTPTQDPRNVHEWRATTTDTALIPLSPPDSVCTQELSLASAISVTDPQVPQATSVILQGSPKKARATLFLFPDGSGSATSYASIPPISPTGDICVIAFNCPFLKKEASMFSCSLDALIDQGYLPELHRRLELMATVDGNVKHTYYVGGWSAGGTLAYRAAQRLLQQEDQTMHSFENQSILAGLVLIDAPPPIRGMDPLPDHFYRYCEQKGVFGGWSGPQARKSPDWLIPHFNGTIAILQHYVAEPLTRAQSARLKTVACIWAGESVVGSDKPLEPHPDDTEGMKFLIVQRTDFSTAGWERLVPGVDEAATLCQRLEGAHHFSLTRSPYVSKLAAFICQAMSLD